jgi:magnesium chelatase family protein
LEETSTAAAIDLEELFALHSHIVEDLVDVEGQDYAKRTLLIAAALHHNVLISCPSGTGETLLAKRLPTILPPLTPRRRQKS